MRMTEKEIQDMKESYLGLIHTAKSEVDIFEGILSIDHIEKQSRVRLVGDFELKIEVSELYPTKLPIVYDMNNSIDEEYVHRYSTGELCLESSVRLKLYAMNHTIKEFIDLFLVNYLCSYCFYRRYLRYPNGERPHGIEGEYDFLKDYFQISIDLVPDMLLYMIKTEVKRNDKCPCGCGKLVKRCHGKKMIDLQNAIGKSEVGTVWLWSKKINKEKK